MRLLSLASILFVSCLSNAATELGVIISPELCMGRTRPELTNHLSEEQRKELERQCFVLRDAHASKSVSAAGIDSRDCIEQLRYRAQQQHRELERECERRAENLASCSVVSQRIEDYGSDIFEISGWGHFDERKSDESTCRTRSIQRAEHKAVLNCEAELGISCSIVRAGEVQSHRVERRRRYIIMGPKENYQVCSAHAAALPEAPVRVKCSLNMEARVTH